MLQKAIKAARCMRHPIYRQSLYQGVAASIEHEDVLRELDPTLVLDVGGNIGQFATLARRLWSWAEIHSFEPLPAAAGRLQGIATLHDIDVHSVAISETSGARMMHVSRRNDSSSLLPIGPAQADIFPGTEAIGEVPIHTARMSEFFSRHSLIGRRVLLKIDVQGGELDVLKGCEDLLDRIEWVYVELSERELYEGQPFRREVETWLNHRGLWIEEMGPETVRDGARVQADWLFGRMG